MNFRPTDARAFLRSRLNALTLGLGLVVAASFVGRLHWLFDLTTHFRAQYFAAALFLALQPGLYRVKYLSAAHCAPRYLERWLSGRKRRFAKSVTG